MSNRRFALLLVLAVIIIGGLWFLRTKKAAPSPSAPPAQLSAAPKTTSNPQAPATVTLSTQDSPEPPFEGIENLNAPGKTIHDDLALLSAVFQGWQTNFSRQGNPFGNNAEITAALSGKNRLHYAMIPRTHPAINRDGELTDRWGTPFFFHQLSGSQMEIRSAGPDRKLYTADDAVDPKRNEE